MVGGNLKLGFGAFWRVGLWVWGYDKVERLGLLEWVNCIIGGRRCVWDASLAHVLREGTFGSGNS